MYKSEKALKRLALLQRYTMIMLAVCIMIWPVYFIHAFKFELVSKSSRQGSGAICCSSKLLIVDEIILMLTCHTSILRQAWNLKRCRKRKWKRGHLSSHVQLQLSHDYTFYFFILFRFLSQITLVSAWNETL